MRAFPKLLAIGGIVVCLGVLIGWLGTRQTEPDGAPQDPPPSESSSPTGPTPVAPLRSNAHQPATGPVQPAANLAVPASADPLSDLTSTNIIVNWEDRLDEVLDTDADEADKAKLLLAMFPRLPAEGKLEFAQHLSNLVDDEEYGPMGRMLADATLPEDVLDVLMDDLLNRPNEIKLPLLLEVARNPEHPEAEEARDLLELYLDEDYGEDWNLWRVKMEEWLRENPD